MPSSYSPNLKIELIAVGEQTDAWGSTTNDNFENVFEEAITGMATATFPSDADYNWAASYVNSVGSQAQRNLVIGVQGTLSATRSLIVPTIEKQYLVHNNTIGGQSIVVKTSAGTGITVPNGQRAHLYVNGTDVISVINYFSNLRIGSATLDSALPIASGGTGQTTANAALNALLPSQGGNAGEYLTTDGTNSSWAALPTTVGSFSAGVTGLTPNTPTTGAVVLAGTLNLANGGTGQTSAQGAMNALAGAVTSGSYLRGNGTNVVMSAIQAADVPTLNQNTTGSAAALSGGAANRIPYNTAAAVTSFIAAPTVSSTYLQWTGSAFAWATVTGGVTSFSAGTTGLTPNSATTGAVTLAGILGTANGGSGQANLTYPTGPETLVGVTAAQTLTNKGITKRVTISLSPFVSTNFDMFVSNGLSFNLTIPADTGTPTDGKTAIFRIVDNGVARTLTWTTGVSQGFRAVGVTLPTTTVANKVLYVGAVYNSNASRWDVLSVAQEA